MSSRCVSKMRYTWQLYRVRKKESLYLLWNKFLMLSGRFFPRYDSNSLSKPTLQYQSLFRKSKLIPRVDECSNAIGAVYLLLVPSWISYRCTNTKIARIIPTWCKCDSCIVRIITEREAERRRLSPLPPLQLSVKSSLIFLPMHINCPRESSFFIRDTNTRELEEILTSYWGRYSMLPCISCPSPHIGR